VAAEVFWNFGNPFSHGLIDHVGGRVQALIDGRAALPLVPEPGAIKIARHISCPAQISRTIKELAEAFFFVNFMSGLP